MPLHIATWQSLRISVASESDQHGELCASLEPWWSRENSSRRGATVTMEAAGTHSLTRSRLVTPDRGFHGKQPDGCQLSRQISRRPSSSPPHAHTPEARSPVDGRQGLTPSLTVFSVTSGNLSGPTTLLVCLPAFPVALGKWFKAANVQMCNLDTGSPGHPTAQQASHTGA